MTDPNTKLERFSSGESFAVDPDAIESELASLWRAAGQSTDGRAPVTRACLWNLVAHLEYRVGREGHGQVEKLKRSVEALPAHLAVRALMLATYRAESDQPELDSYISANCILGEGGKKLVCSEEITLVARGSGERHFAPLVRALQVPAIPVATIFAAGLPQSSSLAKVMHEVDRVVTDLDAGADPDDLTRLKQASESAELGVMDLGWLRLSPVRSLITSLFDPPCDLSRVGPIHRIEFFSSDQISASRALLLGWLVRCLGQSEFGDEDLDLEINVDHHRIGLEIVFHCAGLDAPLSIAHVEPEVVRVQGPHRDERHRVAAPAPEVLIAQALMTRRNDGPMMQALDTALELFADAEDDLMIEILDTPEDVAERAADFTAECFAARRGGDFSLALSGGSTPRAFHAALVRNRDAIEWSRVAVLFSDERLVSPDDARSNYAMAKETLIDPLDLSGTRVHAVDASRTLSEAVESYDRTVENLTGPAREVDLVILGMGADGHTASLFPAHQHDLEAWVVGVETPGMAPDVPRVSFSYRALASAKHVMILIVGEAKAVRFAEVFSEDSELPLSRVLRARTGPTLIVTDAAAAVHFNGSGDPS